MRIHLLDQLGLAVVDAGLADAGDADIGDLRRRGRSAATGR